VTDYCDFPWKHDPGRCELCGTACAVLYRIVIEDSARRKRARVVYACGRHGAGSNGKPLAAPRESLAPGTSRQTPQPEALFDVAPYRRGGGAK
jgi:hypothetical protein